MSLTADIATGASVGGCPSAPAAQRSLFESELFDQLEPARLKALLRSAGAIRRYLASDAPLAESAEKLFQGPIADALTHVGQLAMLRRMAGSAMKGENYHRASIETGRVGPEQSPPRREFD